MTAVAGLIERARTGDAEAFRELTEGHRRELLAHCYRILGSLHDAEDAVQETLVAAWRGLAGFEQRASMRSWLYRIATNRCLNALRSARRRDQQPPGASPDPRHPDPRHPDLRYPEPTRRVEPRWLQPFPDTLLPADPAPGPDARYEAKESISLAFVAAMQELPPRQRAVLVLRDVLGYRASEVADLLDTTEDSVASALKRARSGVSGRTDRESVSLPNSRRERELVDRFTEAFEGGDIDAVVDLLSVDAWLTMPPVPLEYQGRGAIGEFLATVPFRDGRRFRLLPTRANGQPAFGAYVRTPGESGFSPHGLVVLTVDGEQITAITRFTMTGLLAAFGLPASLAG